VQTIGPCPGLRREVPLQQMVARCDSVFPLEELFAYWVPTELEIASRRPRR